MDLYRLTIFFLNKDNEGVLPWFKVEKVIGRCYLLPIEMVLDLGSFEDEIGIE